MAPQPTSSSACRDPQGRAQQVRVRPVARRHPLRQEIEQFFAIYKDLEPDRFSSIGGWGSREQALVAIEEARRRHREHQPGFPA
jgi:hypothetical protein